MLEPPPPEKVLVVHAEGHQLCDAPVATSEVVMTTWGCCAVPA